VARVRKSSGALDLEMARTIRGETEVIKRFFSFELGLKPDEIKAAFCQTPIFKGKTPIWHRSPVSLMKNTFLTAWIIGWLEGKGVKVIQISPQAGTAKRPLALWRRDWKWDGRCSQHARDAADIAAHGYALWRLDEGKQ